MARSVAAAPASAATAAPATRISRTTVAATAAAADVAGAIAGCIARVACGHAVQVVDESPGDAQACVNCEKAGETCRLLWINTFPATGQPPGSAQPIRSLGRGGHGFS